MSPKYPFQVSRMVGGALPRIGQAVLQQQPQPQIQQPQSMGGRIQGILSTLLGAQNRSELSKGLLDFGSRMMAASAPGGAGSFLGALGQSLPATRQTLEGQRDQQMMLDALPEEFRKFGLAGAQMYMNMLGTQTPMGGSVYGTGGWSTPSPLPPESPDYVDPGRFFQQSMATHDIPTMETYFGLDPETQASISNFAVLLEQRMESARNAGTNPRLDAITKLDADKLGELRSAAQGAQNQEPMLEAMEYYASNPEIYQGQFADFKLSAVKLGQALGLPVDENTGQAEAFRQLSSELALYYRNPESGFGMPGSLSLGELAFLEAMVPGIKNTQAGNLAMVRFLRAVNRRKVLLAQAAQRHFVNGGSLNDTGWYEVARQISRENPIIDGVNFDEWESGRGKAPDWAEAAVNDTSSIRE